MTGYLTPDAPAPVDYVYRRVRIPADRQFIANVGGALLELADAWNWHDYGTMTGQEASDLAWVMVDEFLTEGNFMPIGQIFPFATVAPGAHILECDGSTHSRIDYPALYAILDPAFIVDPDTFMVPDLRGRVALGSDAPGGSIYPVGTTAGETDHTLTVGEMPSHSHTDLGHVHGEGNAAPTAIAIGPGVPAPSAIPTNGVTTSSSANLTSTGGSGSHNNMQPYIALRWGIVSE